MVDFWILTTDFVTCIKFNSRIWIFILQCMSPMHMKFCDISLLMLKKSKMHSMHGIWVKCIVNYELFKFPKAIIISKGPLKHTKWFFLKPTFQIFENTL
jgi:hypothetical protein